MPEELVVLLPCHGLADFPFYPEGEVADDLLASYTSIWHPVLIAHARRMPAWRSPYLPSEELQGKLAVLPHICASDLPGYWAEEAQGYGAKILPTVLREDRATLVARAIQMLGCAPASVSAETAADFFALGLCHLLVELLTVQMRYSSLIDEEHFSRHLVAAADAALAQDDAAAHDGLAACFDALNQARGHFYPVESYLVDFTLLAPTTLGAGLHSELTTGAATSLMASGAVVARLAERDPALLSLLRQAVDSQLVSIVGGEWEETVLPAWPIENIRDNFVRGLTAYEQHLGCRPRTFGRRRAGLTPWLPQLLDQLNFSGAVHVTLDDGRFPQARQSLIRWEGPGGSALEALARVPLDAALPQSVLALPQHMGSAMDADHVAIVTFAHWPGKTSIWYEELRRSARFAPTVGRFVTVETLLSEAEAPGESSRFQADQYASPYLAQQVAAGTPNPISQIAAAHQERASNEAAASLAMLTAVLSGSSDGNSLSQFASYLPHGKDPPEPCCLVVNPLSFARRVVVRTDDLPSAPDIGPMVYSAGEAGGRREVVVELPPMGYAALTGSGTAWSVPAGRPLAEAYALRNEFFEITISPETGAITSIYTPGHRGNRLSQQLALRAPGPRSLPGERWIDPDDRPRYSKMAAEAVGVSLNSAATGEIASRGRLMDDSGSTVARYEQRTRVERGSRVVQLDITLHAQVELPAEAWQHYFAARFAWPNEQDELIRDVNLQPQITEARRIEAPHYVEIVGPQHRTAILTGGLAYHARSGERSLDTLLSVRGETAVKFRLGIGLDLPYPQQAAIELLTPSLELQLSAPKFQPAASWLFHLDAKNVIATHWEPALDGQGRCQGVRVRLLETAGGNTRCTMRAFRKLVAARRLDLLGAIVTELQPEEDKVMIDMSAGEWKHVELLWS